MSFYPSQTQKVVEEYSINIRNKDRQSIIQKRRQQCLENVATKKIYTFKEFTSSIEYFIETELSDEMRFEMLKPALQFTSMDDFSHQANKLLIMKPNLVKLLKQTVYDENYKLEYRADSLLLLAQMLESNYELCVLLIEMGILDLMIDIIKQSYNHNNEQFLTHSLIGISNCISQDIKIRNVLIENQIDHLLLLILNKYDTPIIKSYIASIMQDWFRNKIQNINIELFIHILQQLLIYQQCIYKDELSWFLYSFINFSLEQTQNKDNFIESILRIPNCVEFMKMKMLEIDQLGCIAIIRTLTKIFKTTTNHKFLEQIFYEEIKKLYKNVQLYEVNMFRLEILRLIQAMQLNPECQIIAEEFQSTQYYYSINNKCQEFTLGAIKLSNFEIFNQQQLLEIAQKCINVLMSQQDEINTLTSILIIIQKIILIDESFCLRFQEIIPYVQQLLNHQNQELVNLADNILNRLDLNK